MQILVLRCVAAELSVFEFFDLAVDDFEAEVKAFFEGIAGLFCEHFRAITDDVHLGR